MDWYHTSKPTLPKLQPEAQETLLSPTSDNKIPGEVTTKDNPEANDALQEKSAVDEKNYAPSTFINQQVGMSKTTRDKESEHDTKVPKPGKQINKLTKEKRRVRFQEEIQKDNAEEKQNFIEEQLNKTEIKAEKSEKAKNEQSRFHEKKPLVEPRQKKAIKMFREESSEKSDYLHENELGGSDNDDIVILRDSGVESETSDIVNLRETRIDDEFCEFEEDREEKSESFCGRHEPRKHEIIKTQSEKKIAPCAKKIEKAPQPTEAKPSMDENNSRNIEDTNKTIGSKLEKLKISEPTRKDSKIPELKLKKAIKLNQEPETKCPSFRLKSRIATIEFPPVKEKLQTPKITFIGAIRENGILSRNIEEAKKVAKKQLRKLEDIGSHAIEFEKFDSEVEDNTNKRKSADSKIMHTNEPNIVEEGIKQESVEIKLGKGSAILNQEFKETNNLKTFIKEKNEDETNRPKEVCSRPFEKSQIKDESAETEIQNKIGPSKEVTNELSIQRLKPVRKNSLPQENTKLKEEEIPCVTFKPKTTQSIEEINQEFKITLFPYVEEEISLSSKIKLKKPGKQPTFEEESIEESITVVEEIGEGSEIDEYLAIIDKERHLEAMTEAACLSICGEEETFMNEAFYSEKADDFYAEEKQDISESQPVFIRRFEDQHNVEGTSLKLKAKIIGNPSPEIKWFRNDQLLVPSERIFMHRERDVIELTIKETNSELDTGVYQCLAKNSTGEVSVDAFVSVEIDNVEFTKNLQKSYTAFERETIELDCETSHSVRTKWWFNDTEISGMDHRAVLQDGRIHKLVIKNISIKDEGIYKCTVKNKNTMTVVNIMQGKLKFLRSLQDLEITEKNMALLEVEINSDSAEVLWFKNSAPIEFTDNKFKTEKYKGVRKLFIGPISIHDEGEYTCKLLEQECKADISVIELPPEILVPLQDKTVAIGEKAVFEIELSKGDAMVKWYKDGEEIQFSERIRLIIDGKIQKLEIYNCEMDDHGTYTCEVSEQSCSALLNVHVPSCFWIKPLPEETIVPISLDAEFEVRLSKNVELTWWRGELEIGSSSKYIFSDNKLLVKAVEYEDQDVYTCKVDGFNLKTSSKLKVTDKATLPTVIADKSQSGDKTSSDKHQWRDQVSMSESTSWLKENSMDAGINSYQKSKLLPKDEYFFKIWCYVAKLFK